MNRAYLTFILGFLIAGAARAADPSISARIEPSEIPIDQAARLTITATGDDLPQLPPPVVPGLDFAPVGQSRRVESINGVTNSTFTVVYEVRARQAGTYVIASIARGAQPLMLRVDAAAGDAWQPGASAPHTSAPAPAPGASTSPDSGDIRLGADGAAFVRVRLPTRELYVGQSVPIEIQVGTRDGVVASLNGLPALKGDAFTLDRLSAEPERRTEEIIDGKPFTLFSWHGVLAAIKPGELSLTMETPLTVRIAQQRITGQLQGGSALADALDDPAFQGFFGGATEKEVVVSSPPANFTVLELPAPGRPRDFSGAVGDFRISSEFKDHGVAVGDPATLRMRVSGEGNFDRINSNMLTEVEHWKAYPPTAKFTSADTTSYRGDKTFEQAIVPTQAGKQTLPGLSFSYFNPSTRRYETARTEPLTVDVAPAAAGPSLASVDQLSGASPAPNPGAEGGAGLRADHAPYSGAEALIPVYFQARFIAIPSLMILALPGAWFWLQRRERLSRDARGGRVIARSNDRARLAAELDRATAAGDGRDFFCAARAALQSVLSERWQVPPNAVTLPEIEARLGPDSDVRKVFALADEVMYCGRNFARQDLEAWLRIVRYQMQQGAVHERARAAQT